MTTLPDTASALNWLRERQVAALSVDSRRLPERAAFIAWPGHAVDGRKFVRQALNDGALACLVEAEGVESFGLDAEPRVASVAGLKAATGPLASAFLGQPSHQLRMVATTGTNGKTSTAWWTAQALASLNRRCAVIGTLGAGEPPQGSAAAPALDITGMTTPDPVTLQALLRRFVDAGIEACAIEASSIGLVEQRLAGTRINVALFTNFTQDHLDFHGSMTTYWQAKASLFDWPGLEAAVLNIDDEQGRLLAQALASRAMAVWTCSANAAAPTARLQARDVRYDEGGLCFAVSEQAAAGEPGGRAEVRTGLIGDFNVSNLLVVLGGLRALGVALPDAARACSVLTSVPGRMQRVMAAAESAGAVPQPEVVVDYAHTPDALDKVLQSLRPWSRERGGQLWCVFGCGGNRDAGKRPLMGAIAQQLAEQVVVTSDNPRNEQPEEIVAHIVAGLVPTSAERAANSTVQVIVDRGAAIAAAIAQADARDVILIAGKGHEDYQEIRGVKQPFSDAALARQHLQSRRAAA